MHNIDLRFNPSITKRLFWGFFSLYPIYFGGFLSCGIFASLILFFYFERLAFVLTAFIGFLGLSLFISGIKLFNKAKNPLLVQQAITAKRHAQKKQLHSAKSLFFPYKYSVQVRPHFKNPPVAPASSPKISESTKVPNVTAKTKKQLTIEQIDGMDGHAFEFFCASVLKKNNFINVNVTPGSGDQGVDILATKDDIRYAIQCKNYSTPLSNRPIQEVTAGKSFYSCHVGVVMTNSTFSPGAIALAKATGTLLWDRQTLAKMMQAE